MTALRSTGYLAKRVRQTPALFRNFPAVFADLALGRTRLARSEMTLRLRNGLTITTPNVDGARFPVYEIFADDIYRIEALTSGVDPDATIVDGGGQVGCFSMALAHALPGARVHVYEASPTSASYVRRNVTGNGFGDRVTVHAKALAGEAAEFTFVDSGTASSHNGLTAPEDSGQEVTVPAVTFDDAVREAGGSVQIVKLDIEGAEYDLVLQSKPESWRDVRKVVMEYHPVAGRDVQELVDFFAGVGLVPERIDKLTEAGLGTLWLHRAA